MVASFGPAVSQEAGSSVEALPSGHAFSHLQRHARKLWTYSTTPPPSDGGMGISSNWGTTLHLIREWR